MMEEGYIQFTCHWTETDPESHALVAHLLRARQRCHAEGLIGAYPGGLGFGNVSVRVPGTDEFLITGTQTGHIALLARQHCVRVTSFDVAANEVTCHGPMRASSEALSHAALYSAVPGVGAVLHSHHHEAWTRLVSAVPTTAPNVEAGTVGMAEELARLCRDSNSQQGIIAMDGHADGLISYGRDLQMAVELMLMAVTEPAPELRTPSSDGPIRGNSAPS